MEWSAVNSDAVGIPPAPDTVAPVPPAPSPSELAPATLELTTDEQREQRDVREAWEMALRRRKWVRWIVSWLPHRLTILIRSLLRVQHLVIGKINYRWHRSLQLRVVGTTLVISAAMIAVLGFFLTEQIDNGLVLNAESSARTQMQAGLNTARAQSLVNTQPASGADAWSVMTTLGTVLQPTNSGSVRYYVAVGPSSDLQDRPGYPPWDSSINAAASLPQTLLTNVRAEQQLDAPEGKPETLLYYAPTTLTFNDGLTRAAIVVGAPLGDWYQLYYFFPLDNEQQTLQLVQTTLIGVGIALVLLLAAIASLVTRWVVLPIRHAARAAQRVAAGRLEERMAVGGKDDLGSLATSFNDMAASLQEKLQELEELSKAQRQFVSDVSHELRTPMTTIRMAAEILFESREQLDPAAARSAELLQSQIERFETLLTDLLEMSRHDANVATLDAELADISDIVRRSADDAQQLAERRGCRIEFRLPAQACMAEVDRRRVERILRNLLVNAVEHGEGRDVVVTVAADRDTVAIAVRDHGVGLGPGEEQLVFERFWRADPSRARTVGGTGLGLAISLEDARLHGGWLQAWGEKGRGSVFRLTMPREAGQPLAGSPLPLGPDEAEIVTSIVTVLENDLTGGGRG
ncbi:MAG TPA: MtrAB system histidine kinase MtrB [Trebonia sp.]|jgi:two-component system sensor histidine kinase MtrB|nr:MtrAB system histidine kinase MtrB [Trebonia sp.]